MSDHHLQELPVTGYIRQAQLLRYIPVSPATLWRWVKSDQFVSPSKLSERVTAWRCEDVRSWLEAQGAHPSQNAARPLKGASESKSGAKSNA